MAGGSTAGRAVRTGLAMPAAAALLAGLGAQPARADDAPTSARVDAAGMTDFFDRWAQWVASARATQPQWSSPVATTTGLLEQRLRFDIEQQNARGGRQTTQFDGGRGLDLIVGPTSEIQLAAAPYVVRTTPSGTGSLSGFGDWAFLRLEQRLASSPAGEGNYVLAAWLQVQAPSGMAPITSRAWAVQPTLAFGKGWGDFDLQATVGAVLPAAHADALGQQVATNVALQYKVLRVLWPELELNWTYFATGPRGGRSTVYLTPGLVVGRIPLPGGMQATFGFAYQTAVTPAAKSVAQALGYQNALLFTSRLTF